MRTPGEPMVRVGTSGWSYKSWVGVFYPDGTAPADDLRRYAEHFDTVEVDSTFYRTPTARMVDGWAAATPPGFVFAAKVPQVITHEKRLQGCEAEVGLFLERMGRLGAKCGPLIFQQVRINRDREIAGWAERILRYRGSGASIFAYANNRYQGHAPATVRSLVAALGSAASAGLPPA